MVQGNFAWALQLLRMCRRMAMKASACYTGAVPLSAETYRELEATGQFDILDTDADEV